MDAASTVGSVRLLPLAAFERRQRGFALQQEAPGGNQGITLPAAVDGVAYTRERRGSVEWT
ncbi:hypothetical protein EBU58_14665 [bacterium]|nr:hypothetical protein [bacterium]